MDGMHMFAGDECCKVQAKDELRSDALPETLRLPDGHKIVLVRFDGKSSEYALFADSFFLHFNQKG